MTNYQDLNGDESVFNFNNINKHMQTKQSTKRPRDKQFITTEIRQFRNEVVDQELTLRHQSRWYLTHVFFLNIFEKGMLSKVFILDMYVLHFTNLQSFSTNRLFFFFTQHLEHFYQIFSNNFTLRFKTFIIRRYAF